MTYEDGQTGHVPGPDEDDFYTREPYYSLDAVRKIIQQKPQAAPVMPEFGSDENENVRLTEDELKLFNERVASLLPIERHDVMLDSIIDIREASLNILDWFALKGFNETVKPLIDMLEDIDPKEKPLECDLSAVAGDIFEQRSKIDESAPESHSQYMHLTILGELAQNIDLAATIKIGLEAGAADQNMIIEAHKRNVLAHYDARLKDLFGRCLEDMTI